jgi:hypothetical protein
LKKLEVREAIREAEERAAVRAEIDAEQILREHSIVAFSSISHYRSDEETGRVRLEPAAPRGALRALASFKHKQKRRTIERGDRPGGEVETDVELRLWDKVSALKYLGDVLGLTRERENLPPLEKVLAALPSEFARRLRAYLAEAVGAGGPPAAR